LISGFIFNVYNHVITTKLFYQSPARKANKQTSGHPNVAFVALFVNRTVMFDLMRRGRTLFRYKMALDDFALVMTGMTRKVEFTVTRAIAKA